MQKTVLITGATGGIGMELASAFFKEGYKLALHYHRNEQAAERLKRLYGDGAVLIKADVSDQGEPPVGQTGRYRGGDHPGRQGRPGLRLHHVLPPGL